MTPGPRLRRRPVARTALAVAAAMAVAGLALAACGGPAATGPDPAGGRGQPTTTTIPPRPPAERGLAVTTSQVEFVDSTRQVVLNGTVLAPVRALPTTLWIPAGTGRVPLVVFASGFDVGPPTYARFCATLASAGYLVAAPAFPLEDPALGFPLSRTDLPDEATDVSFVITQLLEGSLAGRIAPGEVAVVGHSDGADVALMTAYEAGHVDARVQAVVAMAPDPITDTVVPSTVPLLLIQGTADNVVPYSASAAVFAQVEAPRYRLSLIGAGHLPPIVGGTAWTPVLDSAVADFLDAVLAGRGPGVTALAEELGASPLAQLQTSP